MVLRNGVAQRDGLCSAPGARWVGWGGQQAGQGRQGQRSAAAGRRRRHSCTLRVAGRARPAAAAVPMRLARGAHVAGRSRHQPGPPLQLPAQHQASHTHMAVNYQTAACQHVSTYVITVQATRQFMQRAAAGSQACGQQAIGS